MPSDRPGQVDFHVGQVTCHSHLPHWQGIRQAVYQLNHKKSKLKGAFFKITQDWILKSKNGFCVSLLNRSIQDHSDHDASKEPKIYSGQGFFGSCTMILDCLVKKFKVLFWILRSNLGFLKETHPKTCQGKHYLRDTCPTESWNFIFLSPASLTLSLTRFVLNSFKNDFFVNSKLNIVI